MRSVSFSPHKKSPPPLLDDGDDDEEGVLPLDPTGVTALTTLPLDADNVAVAVAGDVPIVLLLLLVLLLVLLLKLLVLLLPNDFIEWAALTLRIACCARSW